MKRNDLIFLARLRLLVGYLGEQSQFTWWPSSFFAPSSKAFLFPVFVKTSLLAQYYGVKEAAARVHDNFIGIGRGVFHLFRLPETLEQDLHFLLSDNEIINQFIGDISDKSGAIEALKSYRVQGIDFSIGPVRIGGLKDIQRKEIWQAVARYYQHSFETNNRAYPFFSEGQ